VEYIDEHCRRHRVKGGKIVWSADAANGSDA
jgi:hypothetical protein